MASDPRIWKFPLNGMGRETLNLPLGAKPLTVQRQGSDICLWCIVDAGTKEIERRDVRIIGTGHAFGEDPSAMEYVGTAQDGPFVWHVFLTGASDV